MRPLAIVPFIFALAAFILGFLCLFAGNKPGFLEDYSILTLNISRIGQNIGDSLFDRRQLGDISFSGILDSANELADDATDAAGDVVDAVQGRVDNVTASVESEVREFANDAAASIARRLGLRDFYDVHVMNYCQGYYTPGPVKNATVDDIDKNVTSCKDPSAMFSFDPTEALLANLGEVGLNDSETATEFLQGLNWPEALEDGLDGLKAAFKAQFVMYCIAIGFTFLALVTCVWWLLKAGRTAPLVNIVFSGFAFLFMGIASAIGTAIAVKGSNIINKYGNRIGVEGQRGNGFLGLTWAATSCLFVAVIVGCVGFVTAWRGRKPATRYTGEK